MWKGFFGSVYVDGGFGVGVEKFEVLIFFWDVGKFKGVFLSVSFDFVYVNIFFGYDGVDFVVDIYYFNFFFSIDFILNMGFVG